MAMLLEKIANAFDSSDDCEPEVEFELEEFQIEGMTFELTTVAFMPLTRLAALSKDSNQEISGQKVWCGSLSVLQYIISQPHLVAGREVLELGAGTGIVGMVCHKLGASRVWLTDHDERSLTHMKQDVVRNEVQAKVLKIDWFEPDSGFSGLLTSGWGTYSTSSSDNSVAGLSLVAGDVLYKHALIEPFFATVAKVMNSSPSSSSTGDDSSDISHDVIKLYLCHVPRAGVTHNDIQTAAQQHGLEVTIIPSEEWRRGAADNTEYVPEDDSNRAKVYVMNMKKNFGLGLL
jgi:predicted RNA methylase